MSSSEPPYPFTFHYPAPWKQSADQGGSEILCFECAQLDLEQSFHNAFEFYEKGRRGEAGRSPASYRKGDGPVYLTDFHFVTSFGQRLSQTSNCELCGFFAQMTTEPWRGTYKLLAFCSSDSHLFEPRKKDVRGAYMRRPWETMGRTMVEHRASIESLEHNVFMAVVPEIGGVPKIGVPVRWFETDLPRNGSIYRLTKPESHIQRLVLPRELQAQTNFSLLRAWLSRCRCRHHNCARRKPKGLKLPGFRVIDCRKVPPQIEVRPWSERYVALSYVWGPPSGDWPQTILDAVEVTKRLGERYLWVDRTCIDQSNPEEKMFLISKMDAIYQGAEFTIVCAAGDARTGLPGVSTTPRRPQTLIELYQRSAKAKGKSAVRFAPGSSEALIGITKEEYDLEQAGEAEWLDDIRFGLRGRMAFDFGQLLKDHELEEKYDIPSNHLAWYRQMAEDDGHDRIEDYLDTQKELARRIGIPLRGLVPHFKREIARKQGWDLDPSDLDRMPIPERPLVDSSKPKRPLPPSKKEGRLTLVTTMQDPRTTIRNSQWATRGWTYQEGVLSNRRLVFTKEQVYWECRGMAVCETVGLALDIVHEPSGGRMADCMLSGIFDDDLHEASELQYGFQPLTNHDNGDRVVTLDGHISAFTARKLTDGGDSLGAFMGVAASYTTDAGLYLLLGLPVWAGTFANDKPGLQHTFALSLSSWTHVADPVEHDAKMYVADCPRRNQFPSWTWAGWQGAVQFCNEKQSITHRAEDSNGMVGVMTMLPGPPKLPGQDGEFETAAIDPSHSDFFKALTSKDWVGGMKKIWSAEMMMHNIDGTYAALLSGWTPVRTIGDPTISWLLTIQKPLVLRHMHLMHSTNKSEWRRLIGKIVTIHLSIPIPEAQLVADHESGHLITVLVFASMIPYVYNGIARYLILRRADENGCWEKIGRLNMWLTEQELEMFRTPEDMIAALPIKSFGEDVTII